MIRPLRRPRRLGFTLVEVLVAILIIGILAALLIPAVQNAIATAKDAAVSAEITNLSAALAAFKNKYGDYPPSRIILNENGDYSKDLSGTYPSGNPGTPLSGVTWYSTVASGSAYSYPPTGADIGYDTLVARSLSYLRRFFPRAEFSTSGPIAAFVTAGSTTPPSGYFHDFNGDGMMARGPILLQGHECLTFFLGGIPSIDFSNTSALKPNGLTGFGKSPTRPFLSTQLAQFISPQSNNRETGFFEFNAGRLIDEDGDLVPGYIDSLGTDTNARFYAYFSAYGPSGSGDYDANDVNFGSDSSLLPTNSDDDAYSTGPSTPAVLAYNLSRGLFFSAAPNPYTTSTTVPYSAAGGSYTPTGSTPVYVNAQSFQIISAGRDRAYGIGGQYVAGVPSSRLPVDNMNGATMPGAGGASVPTVYPNSPTAPPAGDTEDATLRGREKDNLTNFSGGRLEP